MKKYLVIILFALWAKAEAQITLEHTYDSASTFSGGSPSVNSQLMIVKFEVSGDRYVRINRWDKTVCIYDLNHTLLKTISCATFPTDPSGNMGSILYLSEQLFDTDTGIEFMYTYESGANSYTGIYNDDGTLIFSEVAAPLILVNYPLQQYPIYNTSQGTKMILSYNNFPSAQAKVFSLPGTLTTGIQNGNEQLVQAQGGSISNLYPNPSNGAVTLQYELPKGETSGEMILYNQQGAEVKRFKVDDTFGDWTLDNTQLSSGTYFYQLTTSKGAVGTKKMVVVK